MYIAIHDHLAASVISPSAATKAVIGRPINGSPSASSAAGISSTSASTSASITANDFLELLVTEMKNQDPTATTDPNQYIDQLVQVNSLEQLIQINQDLSVGNSNPAGPTSRSVFPKGNLSAVPSNNEKSGVAGRVATALEPKQDPSAAAKPSQLSHHFPVNILHRLGLQ